MGTYIQMGHNSNNLLKETNLKKFSGAILSPVNESEESLKLQINDFESENFEMIFDPQLYYPDSSRGQLHNWEYFPSDFETADQASQGWWNSLNNKILDTLEELAPSATCSPAFVPKVFSDKYYEMNNWIANNLNKKVKEIDVDILLTSIVKLSDLTEDDRSAEIASIMTSSEIERAFLVFLADIEPRRELNDTEELKAAMNLIHYLEDSGMSTLVGFTSSDIILWKEAGAQDCASGKFFNLRRFTPARWEPAARGGGQLPYWFEESLMAYLREADLQRLRKFSKGSSVSSKNPFCKKITEILDTGSGEPWLSLSWKQYLYWFSDFEARYMDNKIDTRKLLKDAEKLWMELDDADVLFDETHNDGLWVRRWRKAIVEYNNAK